MKSSQSGWLNLAIVLGESTWDQIRMLKLLLLRLLDLASNLTMQGREREREQEKHTPLHTQVLITMRIAENNC
jgi:hypothetical protein